jgi:CHAT domain-containing protein
MDERRLQAYAELIKQLLGCSLEQEGAVLQAHGELLDAQLLVVLEQAAQVLENRGDDNAVRLREIADQLTTELKMGTEVTASSSQESAAQFLLETLQLISDSEGDPQRVHLMWTQQQSQLENLALLEVLSQVSMHLFTGDVEKRFFWATMLSIFGTLIQKFPLGVRWLNLELSITAFELVLQVYTRKTFPEQWAMTQNDLAGAYLYRIQGERADNLEQSISLFKQALQVYTPDAFLEDWANAQNNLAIAYLHRVREKKSSNIEQSIKYAQQAIQALNRDTFPAQWAAAQTNLANAYMHRIRGNKADNLERAISIYEQALQVSTREAFPEQWTTVQLSLGAAYFDRIRGNKADNLERAISIYEQALQVSTREAFPEQWAKLQHNLVNTYSRRIRGERADNLERAISISEQVLKVFTREAFPEQWATTQRNLANVYFERIRGDKADNLEQVIIIIKQVLQVFTCYKFPQEWGTTQNNLANAYSERIRGDKADNLEQAIITFEQVLRIFTRSDLPELWARTQLNLANIYFKRIEGRRTDNLEQAIIIYEQILEVYTRNDFPEEWAMVQYNLAIAYSECNPVKAVEAVTACQRALGVFTVSTFPKQCRKTAKTLGDLYSQQQAWIKAADAYRIALEAAEILYRSCVFLEGKGAELKENLNLSRCAAYAFAQNRQLQDAIKVLEQGRARGLSESLDRDRANLAQLQQVAPLLYQQYRDITQQIRDLENQQRNQMVSSERHHTIPETHRNLASSLYHSLDQIINEIRQIEGYRDFLAQLNLTDVWSGIQPNNPLIYLVSTPVGSLALMVTSSEITESWLDQLTESSLINELLGTWFDAYIYRKTNPQGWFDAIDQITHQLWQSLMEPVVHHLKTQHFTQAILIPTGFLSFLPLHAAWTKDPSTLTGRRYVIDDIHFTYIPNARSLSAAQAIATHTQPDSILAIDDPRNDLSNSAREIEAAIQNFHKSTVLRHSEATIDNVRSHLTKAAIIHFSCHGTANLDDPLNSGLLMSDGLLTLRDILALNLSEQSGIRLAILSACETGLSGVENADEAISLPTGLLQAGVAGTVASLWAVSDLSTRLLLVKFYELWREEKLPPDQALHQAQIWLRDSTDGEKEDFFPDFIALDRSDRSFAHPYHWAAFSYTGV